MTEKQKRPPMTNYQNRRHWAIDQLKKTRESYSAGQHERDAERQRLALVVMYQSVVLGALR